MGATACKNLANTKKNNKNIPTGVKHKILKSFEVFPNFESYSIDVHSNIQYTYMNLKYPKLCIDFPTFSGGIKIKIGLKQVKIAMCTSVTMMDEYGKDEHRVAK